MWWTAPAPSNALPVRVRDVVIGMADGLTVPFALAAGLTAAVSSSHVIVTAGLAEVAAGAIAMGLGGYLAARSDQEHYASEEKREYEETVKLRDVELEEVATIFRCIWKTPSRRLSVALSKDLAAWR
jgi:vacuolar iron transporter family protein